MKINRWFVVRVVVKAGLLFLLINLLYAAVNPLPVLQEVSVYNTLVPGRERLPFSRNPQESYSVTLLDLDVLLNSHELTGTPKAEDEYRVLVLGDSQAWGWLLQPDETFSACLNRMNLQSSDGRRVRAYNLGYPLLNATKDLLFLDATIEHEPDMVLWLVTLNSLVPHDQLYHDVLRANPDESRALIAEYGLRLDPDTLPDETPSWDERTLVGQRETLATWLRYQVYGLGWAATGVDHRGEKFFQPVVSNMDGGTVFFDARAETVYAEPVELGLDDLSFDVLAAGARIAEENDAAFLLVNEPIYRSEGVGSEQRYNFYYPRWAFDAYRVLLADYAAAQGWQYLDLWDAAPNDQFTDTSFHLTPAATCDIAALISEAMQAHEDF